MQEVCARGFRLDASGLIVQVGNFTLPGLFEDVCEEADDDGEAEKRSLDMNMEQDGHIWRISAKQQTRGAASSCLQLGYTQQFFADSCLLAKAENKVK